MRTAVPVAEDQLAIIDNMLVSNGETHIDQNVGAGGMLQQVGHHLPGMLQGVPLQVVVPAIVPTVGSGTSETLILTNCTIRTFVLTATVSINFTNYF